MNHSDSEISNSLLLNVKVIALNSQENFPETLKKKMFKDGKLKLVIMMFLILFGVVMEKNY